MKMTYIDGWGREQVREIITAIPNIEDFAETMGGYAWLVVAANPHLSAAEVSMYLTLKGGPNARPTTWCKNRRRMFRPPDFIYDTKVDRDGKAARAVAIMAEPDNRKLSGRALVRLLREHGIDRGLEWVRQHRGDGYVTADGQ